MSIDAGMEPVPGESRNDNGQSMTFNRTAGTQVGSGNVQVNLNHYPVTSALGEVTALLRVPAPGELYQPRPAVQDHVVELLTRTGSNAMIVCLAGMSGAGKTSLAQAVAHDPRVTDHFRSGGVWWLVAGDLSDAECQAAVQREFDPSRPGLGERLSGANCLIVLDNVTRTGQINATLTGLGPGSALLVTTWDLGLRLDVTPVIVGKWADPEARTMLAAYAGESLDTADAERVLARCDGLPIALAVCGAMVKAGRSWSNVARLLDRTALDVIEGGFPHYPVSLRAAMVASTSCLTAQELARYTELAIFAGGGPVPIEAALRLWACEGLDLDDTINLILRLRDRSLLFYRGGDQPTFQLHDLQYEYVRSLAGERLAALHGRLAATYLDAWGDLSTLDPAAIAEYALIHLAHHLAEAGQDERLHAVLAAESADGVNVWHAAHERSGLTGRYRSNLRLARARAQGACDRAAAPGELAAGIALEIRYALMLSSLTSAASALPPRLLAALVSHGEWTVDQACAYARVMTSPANRAEALTALARFTRAGSAERRELVEEAKRAAAGIDRGMYRAFAIQRLVGRVPEQEREALFEDAWAAAGTDEHQPAEEIRAWLLHNVARVLPERVLRELRRGLAEWEGRFDYPEVIIALLPRFLDLRADVLAIARDGRHTGRLRAEALGAVLKTTPLDRREELVGEALALIESARNDFLRREYTIILMPHLPVDRVRRFLAGVLNDERPGRRLGALTSALPHLPECEQRAALAAATDAIGEDAAKVHDDDLLALLPFLDEADWIRLVGQVIDRKPAAQAVWLVCDLLEHDVALPERTLQQAADMAASARMQHAALNRLAPYLTPRLLGRALTQCALDEPSDWAPAEAHLSPRPKENHEEEKKDGEAPGNPGPAQLLHEGRHVCRALRELARLAPAADPARRREMLRDGVAAGLAPHAFDDFHCSALGTLASVLHLVPVTERLPLPTGETGPDAPGDGEERMRRLALLAIYRQDNVAVSDALRSVTEFGASKDWRAGSDAAQTLVQLAGYLSDSQLLAAADVACGLRDADDQAIALAALTRHATTETRRSVLPKAHAAMREITSAFDLTRPLADLFPYLPAARSAELLSQLVRIAEPFNNSNLNSLPEALARLAPCLPVALFPQAAQAVETLPAVRDRAMASQTLAVAWEERHPGAWPEYWRTALSHATDAGRPTVLALIARLPVNDVESLAERVLRAMSDVRRWWPAQS